MGPGWPRPVGTGGSGSGPVLRLRSGLTTRCPLEGGSRTAPRGLVSNRTDPRGPCHRGQPKELPSRRRIRKKAHQHRCCERIGRRMAHLVANRCHTPLREPLSCATRLIALFPLARVGPTTPTRARRPFDASVDHTEARNDILGCFGRSDRSAQREVMSSACTAPGSLDNSLRVIAASSEGQIPTKGWADAGPERFTPRTWTAPLDGDSRRR